MEANLKDIATAALRVCRQGGSKAGLVELAYAACLLDEQHGWQTPDELEGVALSVYNNGQQISDLELSVMAEQLAQQLTSPQDPAAAATATLQIALEQSYKQQQQHVEAEQSQLAADISRLATAVAHKRVSLETAGLKDYQTVFESVVDYVCAAAGLANRTSAVAAARAEVSAAVESVFPLSGVAYFITLPGNERRQQIESLARVVAGICLFNAANNSNSTAAALLPPSTAAQIPQARKLLDTIQAAVNDAEMAFEHYNKAAAATNREGVSTSSGFGASLFCCQAVMSLRRLAADLIAGMKCCQELDEGITAALHEASRVVSGSISGVPKDIVYPLFESAGRLHVALTGELRLLLVRARLWDDTSAALEAAAAAEQPGSNSSSTNRAPKILGFSKTHGIGSSASSAGSRKGLSVSPAGLEVLSEADTADLPTEMQFVTPEAVAAAADDAEATSSSEWQVALGGMCPVSLADSAAAAVNDGGAKKVLGQLADPDLGYIRFNGVLLGFSSADALHTFVKSPQSIVDGIQTALHNVPLLGHTLGLTTAAAAEDGSSTVRQLFGDGCTSSVLPVRHIMQLFDVPVKVDAETQTPTHFVEKNVDVNYEWNEWALRRRIIALANLRNKATHSAQTVLSHFRREGESQTWQPKTAAVQTKVDKSSTMPKKLRYVTGLRGAPPPPGKKTQVNVVALELDIGQSHQY